MPSRKKCVLCDEHKPASECMKDYARGRIIFKCYDCVQDIFALDYGYDEEVAV